MKKPLGAPVALLCGVMLIAGCGEDESFSAEGCLVAPTVGFQGREYTEFDEVNGVPERMIRVGRLLGMGELPRYCGRGDGDRVQVFKVVGVAVKRAIYVEPPHGLAVRSHFDQE
jgi:hypothetical protein